VQGRALNDQQLIGYLFLLIGAGNDTTRNATAGGLAALLEHPAERDRLCADPGLLGSTVDEVLRWTSPVISFLRTATRDFDLAGTAVRAGETVCMFYPSANRDEQHFVDPYRFDIARTPNDYLTFGYGAHFCLGTNLARAELAAMLKALIPYLPRLELAGGARRIANTHVSGYSCLPLRAVA
jgi:cytochrome P450